MLQQHLVGYLFLCRYLFLHFVHLFAKHIAIVVHCIAPSAAEHIPTKVDTTLDPISIHLNDLVYNLYWVTALPLGLSNLLSIATLVVDKVKDIQSHRAGTSRNFISSQSIALCKRDKIRRACVKRVRLCCIPA